ncbi:hypothetical protein HYALB_00000974 [Hymenoscyphus albidus]|uniref:DUF7924 domain-containing protein n=1 Tax=Hymenoscyphus albidus TaxID=595503 RepID=A0A9N9Q1Q9_9HELO|nr:hypothetical protein HYALB_00000974 [Hymenoscyphus albidus]
MALSSCYAIKLTPIKFQQNLSAPLQDKDRKRKRAQGPKEPPIGAPSKPLLKRPRTSVAYLAFGDTSGQSTTDDVADTKINPIIHWIEKQRWPKEYFEQDYQTRRDFEKDSWFEKYWEPENKMNHILARKKSASSLRGKQSEASSAGSSDQKPRDIKSAPYQDARYETILATKGSFMGKSQLGVTATSKDLCRTLLEIEQTFPDNSLFHDDLFEDTCEMVRNKNEARVVRDISPLIVPPAEVLAIRGAKHLKILIESVNEGWNNSIPITKTRPQPDYSVAFRREAFTEAQLKRIEPFVGELTETSFFMATYSMYFPFFTCEAKCGAAALDVADRQNAHSMTMAMRGIVELFRLVKREKELHRQILAFSISHDHSSVRIYGHYPLVEEDKTTFYRHPIHKFDFTAMEGKEKWTAYKFTKNVYDIWMPDHFKRICSVIDTLPPDINFEVSRQSEPGESRLSQGSESHHLSNYSSQLQEEADRQSIRISSQNITPQTSVSERIESSIKKGTNKRPACGITSGGED